jgi:hypothetical protein
MVRREYGGGRGQQADHQSQRHDLFYVPLRYRELPESRGETSMWLRPK